VKAVDLIKEGRFGCMVALRGNENVALPLAEVTGGVKEVDLELYDLAQVFY
jgi:6-phosphofructokinase 1